MISKKTVQSCEVCQKTQKRINKSVRFPWPKPKHPWERIHLDFFYFQRQTFLIITDAYSKWVECFQMQSTNVSAVISKLNEVFSRFSIPVCIVCDNGSPFQSRELQDFCRSKDIKLLFSPPYNPESNGLAERSVQTFKHMLNKALLGGDSPLSEVLTRCLYNYRSTPSSVTGYSLMSFMLTFVPRSPLSHINPKSNVVNKKIGKQVKFALDSSQSTQVQSYQQLNRSSNLSSHSSKVPLKQFNINDPVLVCC